MTEKDSNRIVMSARPTIERRIRVAVADDHPPFAEWSA